MSAPRFNHCSSRCCHSLYCWQRLPLQLSLSQSQYLKATRSKGFTINESVEKPFQVGPVVLQKTLYKFNVLLPARRPGTYDFGFVGDSKHPRLQPYTSLDKSKGFWEFKWTGYTVVPDSV